MRRAPLFAFLTVISSLVGLVVYLISRPEDMRTLACPGCAREVNGGAFCPHCGRDLSSAFCPACRYPLKSEWAFCPACRTELKPQPSGTPGPRGGLTREIPEPGRRPERSRLQEVHALALDVERRARALGRPLVASLFVSSALLSIVSWYTTQQGMALYLSPWFAFLASLGIQSALVLVAWLVGVSEGRRGLLIAVYAVTASGLDRLLLREPAHLVRRRASGRPTIERASTTSCRRGGRRGAGAAHRGASARRQKHVLALEEMTAAEKAHGYISRAAGPGPVPRARPRGGGARGRELRRRLPGGAGRRAALHRLRQPRGPRAPDGRAALRESRRGARRACGAACSRSTRPSSSCAASGRCSTVPWSDVRETLHAEVETPACRPTPTSWTARPRARRTW